MALSRVNGIIMEYNNNREQASSQKEKKKGYEKV